MKRIPAIFLAVLALLLFSACNGSGSPDGNGCLADSGTAPTGYRPAVSGEDYEGGWYDAVSQRCGMEIKPLSANKYKVTVSWGSSAYETTEWEMTAEFDGSDGTLRYTDGKKQTFNYDTEDADPICEVLYTDSAGFLRLDNDRISWSDDKDRESSDSRLFLNTYEYEDYPKDIKFLGFYYRDEDASSVEIYYDKGVMMVTVDITRLASMSGNAFYDAEKDILTAEVTDPGGNPMELSLKKTDSGLAVTVENSTWDYIQNGDTFIFG